MAQWFTRMHFDSRFAFSDDPFHRIFEVVHLCFLATAVVHIRTVDVMSNPSEYPDMFGYSLGLSLLTVMNICRNAEIYFFVDGEPGAKNVTKKDVLNQLVQLSFFLAAAVVSATQYYDNNGKRSIDSGGDAGYTHDDGAHRGLFTGGGDEKFHTLRGLCSGIISIVGAIADESGIRSRLLADTSDYNASSKESYYDDGGSHTTDIPLWLCLAGYLYFLVHLIVMVLFCFPSGGRHKAVSVPMNIDFCIHRLGEWTMLLLGESILSLLIVETSTSAGYYVTFYAGIISVVLLQYLHFRSQPHHADEHAMRRNKNAGMLFSTLMQTYSFALVAVGVSYKMLLYEYTYEEKGYRLRRLLQHLTDAALRHLAGGGTPKYTAEERQQRVANFFCGSMAIAWICLDWMCLTHQGIRRNVERCEVECQLTSAKRVSRLGVMFAAIRVGLIAFIASLSQYVQDPELLSIIGMITIVAQVLTRLLGDLVYGKPKVCTEGHDHDDNENDSEDEHWPNITHAAAKPADTSSDVKTKEKEDRKAEWRC